VCSLLERQGTPLTKDEVTRQITFVNGDKPGFYTFLGKFRIFEEIKWDVRAICDAIEQIIWNIARENIDYAELKFSVDKYLKPSGLSPQEIIRIFHDRSLFESAKWGCKIALVLSLKYESDRDHQRKVAKLIEDKVSDCLVGIDLVGDEVCFDGAFYKPLLAEWSKAGKGIEAHVGESCGAENVRIAIEELGATRIAHGVRATDYPDIMALAKERDVCFDIALTSNIQTGVVKSLIDHPVCRLLQEGCAITIGTDDPIILQTSLDQEYLLLRQICNLDDEAIMDIMYNSVKYAFTDLSQ
jgi:adenosine deaminase